MVAAVLSLASCFAMGPAQPGQAPNAIQRSSVLSANEKSITIEHSSWGKPIAFETAAKHCALYNLVSVYKGASQQYGPDVISTWTCE